MRAKLQLLASDAAIYGVTTLLTRSMSFLLTPLYTHFLASRSEFGIYSYLFSLLAFINVLYTFGLDTAFLRFFQRDDLGKTERVFSISWLSIAGISFLSTCVLLLFAQEIASFIPDLHGQADIIRAIALIPLFDALTVVPYNLLRMQRKAKKFAVLRIVNVAFNVCMNLLFVAHYSMGIKGIVIAGFTSSFLAVILVLPDIVRWLRFHYDKKLAKEMMSFGLPTVPSAFSGMMLQVADRPIMTAIAGNDITGLYQANYRLGIPMMMVVAVFEFAYKPFYLSHWEDEDAPQLFARIFTYFIVLCCSVFLTISIFIGDIVRLKIGNYTLIQESYWSGLGIIPIILAAYIFNGAATNFAAGLHISKKTAWLPIATGTAALVNVVLTFVLVPVLGIYGGAWSTFIAYAVSASMLYKASNTVFPIPFEWSRIIRCLLITMLLFTAATFLEFTLLLRLITILAFPILLAITKVISTNEQRFIQRLIGFKRG